MRNNNNEEKNVWSRVAHTHSLTYYSRSQFFLLLLIHLTNAIPFDFFLNPNKFSEIGLTSDHNLPLLWCCMRVSRLAWRWRWRWQTISGNLNIAIKVAENCFYFVFNKCVEHDIFTQKKWEKTKEEKETRWSIKLPSRVFVYRDSCCVHAYVAMHCCAFGFGFNMDSKLIMSLSFNHFIVFLPCLCHTFQEGF